MRIHPSAHALAASALALFAAGCAPRGPNVLLVTFDTLRADHVGCYGASGGVTPRLDALADEGVVFERAVAASSRTAPSHATMMTSLHVREHSIGHINGATRLEGATTLAERFRSNGYRTAAFVGNFVLRRSIGLDAGFDVYDDELPDREANRPAIGERGAADTTGRAMEWLDRSGGAPYFLWVHYQDPHGPYDPPAPYDKRFAPRSQPEDPPLPVLADHSGFGGIPAYQVMADTREPADYRARYAGEIHYADAWLGRLLDAVRAREGRGGTIVLVTSDHGESLGEEGYWFSHGHATTPDLGLIPFILSAPGLASQRRAETVHHVDVLPTLLDLAGLDVPAGSRGVALGRALEGGSIPPRILYCDIGDETSAYVKRGFVRVRAVGGAADPHALQWKRWVLDDSGGWSDDPEGLGSLQEIRAYLDSSSALVPTEEYGAGDVDRLRSLGYIDPE